MTVGFVAEDRSSATSLRLDHQQALDARELMKRRPIPNDPNLLPDAERERAMNAMFARSSARQSLKVRCFGLGSTNMSEGLQKLGPHLDEVASMLQKIREALSIDLARKFNIEAERLPARGALSDLPQPFRDEIVGKFLGEWQAHGFSSYEEAESFVLRSKEVRVSTTLSLDICVEPGMPPRPNVWHGRQIGSFPGTISP